MIQDLLQEIVLDIHYDRCRKFHIHLLQVRQQLYLFALDPFAVDYISTLFDSPHFLGSRSNKPHPVVDVCCDPSTCLLKHIFWGPTFVAIIVLTEVLLNMESEFVFHYPYRNFLSSFFDKNARGLKKRQTSVS